ncbi:MAG: UDP-N-acetylglucosamine 1-carboxyvinyltransferase [Synergistales bacterium]|nr:UDP-N-acetylglucosamine 1-carboxyvinyltransferase [Synergistales bacterium]
MTIQGGVPIQGEVSAQGAKNAALPMMAAALLIPDGTLRIDNVPDLQDTHTMAQLLQELGAKVHFQSNTVVIETPKTIGWTTPVRLVRRMRASSLVLGPLLARCGRAILPLPGGCSIGSRPLDLHLKSFSRMGADIELEHGSVHASLNELKGSRIYLDFPSVGATENLMMAAVLAKGDTVIENAAREPEIINLAETLRAIGALIKGEGTGTIHIKGVHEQDLGSATVTTIPDRIEAATFLLAGIITGGAVTVSKVIPEHMDHLLVKLEEAGGVCEIHENRVRAWASGRLGSISLKTMPFPGFPTDLQPQMMALLSLSEGTSVVLENVFRSRFLHVSELQRMGAEIEMQGNAAIIRGIRTFMGAEVYATDLRAGAALVLAGLSAPDETNVFGMAHVWRGYENFVRKLQLLGADVGIRRTGKG